MRKELHAGDKVDMLRLIKVVGERTYSRSCTPVWLCRCDCGNTCEISEYSLRRENHLHSCGCYAKKLLIPGDSDRMSKAGKARAEKRNKDGVNVDMLFRTKPIKTNTSGVQGVAWADNVGRWHVYIGYKGKRANLGYYDDFEFAKALRQKGLEAVKDGTFEDFYESVRGKKY